MIGMHTFHNFSISSVSQELPRNIHNPVPLLPLCEVASIHDVRPFCMLNIVKYRLLQRIGCFIVFAVYDETVRLNFVQLALDVPIFDDPDYSEF